MQSAIEGEFDRGHSPGTQTMEPDAAVPDTGDNSQHDLTENKVQREVEPTADVRFDVEALKTELNLTSDHHAESFKPEDYSDSATTDRIIIGYRNGEPVYKAEPKPKPLPKPKQRPQPRRKSAPDSTSSSHTPSPRQRDQSRQQYRSTHQLYQERRTHRPRDALGRYESQDTFKTLNNWLIKATHVAAIVVALLLILHYFPLPAS